MRTVFIRPIFVNETHRLLFKKKKMCNQSCTSLFNPKHYKFFHSPVMLNEVIQNFNLKGGDIFLDMTFGAGGHSSALIEKISGLKIIALDRDPEAIKYAKDLKKKYPDNITTILEGKFSDLPNLFTKYGITKNSINGILFDLGCSSMQLDVPERGFSVSENAPLDMRMDGNRLAYQLNAADVISYGSEEDLYKIFKIYGEERKARKIAKELVESRVCFQPLKTTKDLYEFIRVLCSKNHRIDTNFQEDRVTTAVFQSLRMFVNNELNELNYGLVLAQNYLKVGGAAVTISYDSLSDRIVKKHFNNSSHDIDIKKSLTSKYTTKSDCFYDPEKPQSIYWKSMYKKIITPSEEEMFTNPKSQTARLRVAVKCEN